MLSYKLSHLSQVVFLFCAYLGLASIKHAKSKLSLFKFFSDFPDAFGAAPHVSQLILVIGALTPRLQCGFVIPCS